MQRGPQTSLRFGYTLIFYSSLLANNKNFCSGRDISLPKSAMNAATRLTMCASFTLYPLFERSQNYHADFSKSSVSNFN